MLINEIRENYVKYLRRIATDGPDGVITTMNGRIVPPGDLADAIEAGVFVGDSDWLAQYPSVHEGQRDE